MIRVSHAASIGSSQRGPRNASNRPNDRVQNGLGVKPIMNQRRQSWCLGERVGVE